MEAAVIDGGVLCIAGWPETRIGLVVNAALLIVLLASPDLAAR